MARDYAKKTNPKSKQKAKPRKTSTVGKTPPIAWQGFVGGFVLGGLLVGIIVYMFAPNTSQNDFVRSERNETYLSEAAELELAQQLATLDANEAAIMPQFDFYRLLPEMTVEIPGNSAETAMPEVVASTPAPAERTSAENAPTEPETTEPTPDEPPTQVASPTPPASPEVATALHYELQLAAFRSADDADAYKARLALLGYVVNVQDVTTEEGEIWHRIRVGPFSEREQAEQTQVQLQTQQINSLLLQVSG